MKKAEAICLNENKIDWRHQENTSEDREACERAI